MLNAKNAVLALSAGTTLFGLVAVGCSANADPKGSDPNAGGDGVAQVDSGGAAHEGGGGTALEGGTGGAAHEGGTGGAAHEGGTGGTPHEGGMAAQGSRPAQGRGRFRNGGPRPAMQVHWRALAQGRGQPLRGRERRRRAAQANGGTLLIDEIGDLDLTLQPKLLRALERSRLRRVGGDRPLTVEVRILSPPPAGTSTTRSPRASSATIFSTGSPSRAREAGTRRRPYQEPGAYPVAITRHQAQHAA
jgi:Sigma-54 interaction domain